MEGNAVVCRFPLICDRLSDSGVFQWILFFTVQVNYPKLSAAVAGNRKFDVYMGIDVFGRGTYGGGQWTVCIKCLLRV